MSGPYQTAGPSTGGGKPSIVRAALPSCAMSRPPLADHFIFSRPVAALLGSTHSYVRQGAHRKPSRSLGKLPAGSITREVVHFREEHLLPRSRLRLDRSRCVHEVGQLDEVLGGEIEDVCGIGEVLFGFLHALLAAGVD